MINYQDQDQSQWLTTYDEQLDEYLLTPSQIEVPTKQSNYKKGGEL